MAGDVVNLRQARKRRDRARADAEAAANRAKHGTPAALRRADTAARTLVDRRLDAHKLERAPPPSPVAPGDTREP